MLLTTLEKKTVVQPSPYSFSSSDHTPVKMSPEFVPAIERSFVLGILYAVLGPPIRTTQPSRINFAVIP